MRRIALDAMGGDRAPGTAVRGAVEAVRRLPPGFEVLLVGPPDRLEPLLAGAPRDRLRVLPASETIGMEEPPVTAVRRKRDSSIVVGLEAVRGGEADAFISAGSTGAVMAASLLTLGRLPGVDRPAVGAVFPTAARPTLVLDAGANVNCRPAHLHQFAHLGSVYVRDLRGIARPRVGLLNVGREPEKGDDLALAAHALLSSDGTLEFVGNVEGSEIIDGVCDVLVCDGFVGNVLLKFYESIAGFVGGLLTGGEASRPPEGMEALLRLLDYTEYGGAPLLGVNGVSIICHGSSPPRAIRNAIRVALDSVESGMVADMAADLEAGGPGARGER